MKINKYSGHYHNWVVGEYRNVEVLAENEADAKKAVDEIIKPEFRSRHYQDKVIDSLTLRLVGPWEVKYPMVISNVQEY